MADLKAGLVTAPVLLAAQDTPELLPLIERSFSRSTDLAQVCHPLLFPVCVTVAIVVIGDHLCHTSLYPGGTVLGGLRRFAGLFVGQGWIPIWCQQNTPVGPMAYAAGRVGSQYVEAKLGSRCSHLFGIQVITANSVTSVVPFSLPLSPSLSCPPLPFWPTPF